MGQRRNAHKREGERERGKGRGGERGEKGRNDKRRVGERGTRMVCKSWTLCLKGKRREREWNERGECVEVREGEEEEERWKKTTCVSWSLNVCAREREKDRVRDMGQFHHHFMSSFFASRFKLNLLVYNAELQSVCTA